MFGKKIRKQFNGKVRCRDENKIAMNKLLAQYVKTSKMTHKAALVLDSAQLLTRNTLRRAGVKHIDIPNPFEDYTAIKKKHSSTYKMLLSEFLDGLKDVKGIKHSYGVAWFDYCDSFPGKKSDGYDKAEDIKKYFDLKLPVKGSIFAITISYRAKKEGGIYSDLTECDKTITNAAYHGGYTACKIDGKSYNGLYVLFYKIY